MFADWLEPSPQDLAATVLQAATEENFARVVTLLGRYPRVKLAGHLDKENKQGHTALMAAACNGHEAAVKSLLKAGADVDARDERGFTPLIWMATTGHDAMVEILLEAGAEIDAQLANGDTALMRAALRGHTAILRRLLDARAALDLHGEGGLTALMWALRAGQDDATALLLKAGADPWLRDTDQRLAVDWLDDPPAAQALIPAMFDVRWWKDRTPREVRDAWNDIPKRWRRFGFDAINHLSRQFNPQSRSGVRALASPSP